MYADSLDKVIQTYFVSCCAEPFTYKGREYQPRPLYVSTHFFNEYNCVLGCAGCCPRFTLDYIPLDDRPHDREYLQRWVDVGGYKKLVFTYTQKTDNGRFCDNVDRATGACKIHGEQPFSCDFETLRFVQFADHSWLGTRPFGRGWAMQTVDGSRGAKCTFPGVVSESARAEAVRKLERLRDWMRYFEVKSKLDDVIEWAQSVQTVPGLFP